MNNGWSDLEDDVEKLCEEMVNDVKTEASQVMLRSVSTFAPILTGNLLGNTIVSINTPDNSVNNIDDKEANIAYHNGMSKVNSSKPYDKIYIQNNTEYNIQAEFLGWANTPPYGYFEISTENVYRRMEAI